MTNAARKNEFDQTDATLAGWHKTTLGQIGEYLNGRGFKKSEWSEEGLPIIRIQNLTGSNVQHNYYNGEIEERHVVKPGDLLIPWAATLGVYIWDGPQAALNQHIFKVDSHVDKRFHYYLIQNILGELYRQAHGSGMVHITKSKFENTPVLVPNTIERQQSVVAEIEKQFSRLDEAVTNLKRVKANLKRYKAAVLKAAVEGKLTEEWRKQNPDVEPADKLLERILTERRQKWEEAELTKMKAKGKTPKDDRWKQKYKEPVAPDITGLPELPEGWVWASLDSLIADGPQNGLYLPKSLYGSGHPILRIDDYQQDWIRPVAQLQRVRAKSEDIATYSLHSEDLVINRVNSPSHLGKVAVWAAGPEMPVFESNMMRASLSSSVAPVYVATYLRSADGRARLTKQAKWAVNQASINQQDVCGTPVPLPPHTEQIQIVEEVDSRLTLIQEVEGQVVANLTRAERLRQSILRVVFSGGLNSNIINFQRNDHLEAASM